MSRLSDRLRPGVEAAPWVCDEVRKLEQQHDEVLEALRELEWACSGVEYMEAEYADKLKLARDVIAKVTGSN